MLDQYYLMLRRSFPKRPEGEPFEVTLAELTDVFHCTSRNVNLILRRMEELGWIEWSAGRGRGNRSRLTLRIPTEELVLQSARELVQKGDLRAAFDKLDEYAELPFLKEKFMQWLDTRFGYRPEVTNRQTVDTLRVPYSKPIYGLDPIRITYAVESHLVKQLFDTLVRYDAATGSAQPHLAHYWQSDQTGMLWTFFIRKGVLFHHGRELTAHDIKFTYERLRDRSSYCWMFESMESAEVVSPYVLTIRLREPNHMFLRYLAYDTTSIVPADIVRERGELFMRQPVGTGPFHLVQNDDNMVVIEAFPRYFDKRAHLDRIEVWITPECEVPCIPDHAPGYQLHHSCYASSGGDAESQGWTTIERTAKGSQYLMFNLAKDGPQRDIGFRRAVRMGLDRSELPRYIKSVEFADAYSFVPTRSPERHPFDPEQARSLLAESGYNGETLLITTVKKPESCEWLVAQLERLGVRAEVRTAELDDSFRFEKFQDTDIFIGELVMDDDVDLSLMELFLSDNSCIRKFLGAELIGEVNRIVRRIHCDSSADGRHEKVQELEQLIRDYAAGIFLYHRVEKMSHHPSLKGVSLNSLGWISFRDAWFAQAEPAAAEAAVEQGA